MQLINASRSHVFNQTSIGAVCCFLVSPSEETICPDTSPSTKLDCCWCTSIVTFGPVNCYFWATLSWIVELNRRLKIKPRSKWIRTLKVCAVCVASHGRYIVGNSSAQNHSARCQYWCATSVLTPERTLRGLPTVLSVSRGTSLGVHKYPCSRGNREYICFVGYLTGSMLYTCTHVGCLLHLSSEWYCKVM